MHRLGWTVIVLPWWIACTEASSRIVVDGHADEGARSDHGITDILFWRDFALDLRAGDTRGDNLAATDGALAGECLDWQSRHPEWIWCDDFDDGVALADKYPDTGLNGLSVDTVDPLSGPAALHQHYTSGQVDAGWISFFYGDTLGGDHGPIREEIYMRWYHKFEEGFQSTPPKMARITSLGPGWEKRFGVHYWIGEGEIVADVHAPPWPLWLSLCAFPIIP